MGAGRAARAREFRVRAWLRTPSVAVPAGAGLVAVVITALGSWIPSLWGDEAASALSAQRSLPSFLREVTHVDAVHAVYYAALHVWVALFGASAFALRFPSAIATGVTVAGVIVLVRLFTRAWRLPLIAAAFTVAMPRLDFAGIEARGYAWTAAVATWALVAGVVALRGRGAVAARRAWAWFAALAGAGIALNLFVGSVLVVIGCLAVAWGPARSLQLRRWGLASGVAVLLASPVVLFAALEHRQVEFLAHRPVPPSAWLVNQWFGYPLFAVLGWVALLGAAGLVALRRDASLDRGLGLLALLWAGLPSVFLIGTIPTLHNYAPRYLTFAAPAAAVLMALAVDAVFRSWRPAGVAALALLLAAAAPMYAAQRQPNAENGSDWAQVGAVVAANSRPGDQIAFDESVRPSRRPANAWRVYPADFRNVAVPQLVTPYWRRTTWSDRLMTVPDAAEQHRFTASTLFLVDADFPDERVLDTRAVPALEASGYRVVRHWRLHSDLVFQLDREGVDRAARPDR
jgi:mannosyltransferase